MPGSKIDNSTPEFTFTVCMQQQLCSYKQSVGYSGAVGQISRLFVLLGPVQSKSVEWEGRSYLDGRCFCNRNFHTKKLIIFIRRIIFICSPLKKILRGYLLSCHIRIFLKKNFWFHKKIPSTIITPKNHLLILQSTPNQK